MRYRNQLSIEVLEAQELRPIVNGKTENVFCKIYLKCEHNPTFPLSLRKVTTLHVHFIFRIVRTFYYSNSMHTFKMHVHSILFCFKNFKLFFYTLLRRITSYHIILYHSISYHIFSYYIISY